jgi:hypothetical protein
MTRLTERAKGDKETGDRQSTQTANADKPKPVSFFVLKYLTRNKTLPDSGYGQSTEIWPTREEADARVEKLKSYEGTTAFEVREDGH